MVKKDFINKKRNIKMQTSDADDNKKNKAKKLREIGSFIAACIVIFLFGISPFAYLGYGKVFIAVILIPVILGVLLFDKYTYALIFGIVFGLSSMTATYIRPMGQINSFFRNPLVSITPRILMALIVIIVFKLVKKRLKFVDKMSAFVCSLIASIVGVSCHTALTINAILFIYGPEFGCNTAAERFNYAFQYLVGLNPLMELIFTSVIVTIAYVVLSKKKIVLEKDNIKVLFQKWLLLVILVSFLATYYISYSITTYNARVDATKNIELNIDDIYSKLNENLSQLSEIDTTTKKSLLGQAFVVSEMMKNDSSYLTKEGGMKKLCDLAGINEISVVGGDGIVVNSYPPSYIGLDIRDYEVLHKYQDLIDGLVDQIVEDMRLNKGDNGDKVDRYQMFAGVRRKDAPGFVQVAYSSEYYNKLASANTVDKIAKTFRIGNGGGILICKGDFVVSANKENLIGKEVSKVIDKMDNSIYTRKGFIETFDDEELLLFGKNIEDYMIVGYLPTIEVYANRNVQCVFLVVCDILLFAIIYNLILRLMDRLVVNEVNKINESLEKITKGNLGEVVDAHSTSEFDSLSNDINATVDALKDMINVEKTRMEKDLELAKSIQISALPNVFPAFPNRNEFDIYATMDTAKEVGGDFYDFFFISHNKLVFLVADVSGKGIPAAMFMMRAKAIIKNLAESGIPLYRVAEETNRLLCENNEAAMFVTAWLGTLDTETLMLTYVNAGHNPPVYIPEIGEEEMLKNRSGFILGSMEQMKYKEYEKRLFKGDKIYLYTDGVTESINSRNEMYGEDRLLTVLERSKDLSLEETLKYIRSDITKHSEGAEQFDDITMLMLEVLDNNKINIKSNRESSDYKEVKTVASIEGSLKLKESSEIQKDVNEVNEGNETKEDKFTKLDKLAIIDSKLKDLDMLDGSSKKEEVKEVKEKEKEKEKEENDDNKIILSNIDDDDFIVESKDENLGVVIKYIFGKLAEENLSLKIKNNIEVSVEEIFVNVSHYAYGEGTGKCFVNAKVEGTGDNKEVVITFKDFGVRYNPLEKKDPNVKLSAAERPIGGLGIFLVKKFMDDISYFYDETKKQNNLIIKKRLKEE